MKSVWVAVSVLLLAGCSSGLQEVAFMDQGRYIVSRSLVNDRVTANQPHGQGVFSCKSKISSEDMAELRKDGNVHSQYMNCEPSTQYVVTSDQPIATLYKGPIEAAILGGFIGAGLASSGDTISQTSGGSSLSSTTTVTSTQTNARRRGRR